MAVLAIGELPGIREAISEELARGGCTVLDRDLVDAAARGVGYDGSLNPEREDVRRLAAAIGAEVLVLGRASVVERDVPDVSQRWDGFAGLFLVDGRNGNLIWYKGIRSAAASLAQASDALNRAVSAEVREWPGRVAAAGAGPVVPDPADDGVVDLVSSPDGGGEVIPPRFFSRPRPEYTADADRGHVIATVDLIVEFRSDGTYGRIDVRRWAGFGLDASAISAVRSSRFWPARRQGAGVSARALLRFNFRFRDQPGPPGASERSVPAARPGSACGLRIGFPGVPEDPVSV